MITSIQKWGNSLAIRIPKSLAGDSELQEGSTVEITSRQGKIIVKSVKKEYKLKDLVAKINKSNKHSEIGTGKARGKEIW